MNNQPSPWGSPTGSNDNRPPEKPGSSFIVWVIVVVVIVAVIAWVISSDALSDISGANLIYDLLLLVLIGAGLIGHVIGNPGQALRNIAGWIIIFGVLGLGYSIWNGNSQIGSELNPTQGIDSGEVISFRADLSGHFLITAKVNGVEVDFLVDTGATHVVLSSADAKKIGYNLDQLSFNMPASTANGIVYSAPIRISNVAIGPIYVENVEGAVNKEDLGVSLLGMSFLNKLSGYEVRNGLLTLYP